MITLTFEEASRPRMVAPPGWTLLATRLVPPGGGEVIEITQMSGRRDEPLDQKAAREGARLAERLAGYTEESLERRTTRTGEALVRTYAWELEGRPQRGIQMMGAGGALATLPATAVPSEEAVGAVAEAVGAFAFGAPQGLYGAYSIEELTALAELVGATTFPGTGEHAFSSEESRQAARRALLARGTLHGDPNGALEIDTLDRRTVETALNPESVLRIAVRGPGGVERCLVYTANAVSVAQSAGSHGVHRLEAVPSVLLGAVVRALTRPETEAAAPGEPRTISVEELDQLSRTGSSTSVEVVAAEGGGESLSWLERDGGLWLVAPNGSTATLAPASRAQIDERLVSLCAPLSGRGVTG